MSRLLPPRSKHTWPDRPDYRPMNGGLGCCTGSGKRGTCVLGGIGCDVDHLAIARQHLQNTPGISPNHPKTSG